MVYIVAYDLVTPHDTSENYTSVINALKDLGTWARIEQSVWLIESSLDRARVRDVIVQSMHKGDRLIVAGLNGAWAESGISDEITAWLKGRKF